MRMLRTKYTLLYYHLVPRPIIFNIIIRIAAAANVESSDFGLNGRWKARSTAVSSSESVAPITEPLNDCSDFYLLTSDF